jgi:hypothetical protein
MVRVVSPAGETGMLVVDSVVIPSAYDSKLVFLSYHLSCYLLYYAILYLATAETGRLCPCRYLKALRINIWNLVMF